MHKILIAITGNISSGKTSILNHLQKRGYKIFNADDTVHNLYERLDVQKKVIELLPEFQKLNLREKITSLFCKLLGYNIKRPNLDKTKLANIIFADNKKRKLIENLIHPMVTIELEDFKKRLNKDEMGFAEIPLLFETKMENFFDYTILVYCDKTLRLKRASGRGISQEKFDLIDKVQMSSDIKKNLSDFIIDSNNSKEALNQKVDDIIEIIEKAEK